MIASTSIAAGTRGFMIWTGTESDIGTSSGTSIDAGSNTGTVT